MNPMQLTEDQFKEAMASYYAVFFEGSVSLQNADPFILWGSEDIDKSKYWRSAAASVSQSLGMPLNFVKCSLDTFDLTVENINKNILPGVLNFFVFEEILSVSAKARMTALAVMIERAIGNCVFPDLCVFAATGSNVEKLKTESFSFIYNHLTHLEVIK